MERTPTRRLPASTAKSTAEVNSQTLHPNLFIFFFQILQVLPKILVIIDSWETFLTIHTPLITMRKVSLIALIALLILATIATVRAEDAIENKCQDIKEGEVKEGPLSEAPEYTGKTECYLFNVSAGYTIAVNINVTHIQFLSARIIIGFGPSTGGYYLYYDDIIKEKEKKTYQLNWYTVSEEKFKIILTAIADRYAPSNLSYAIKVNLKHERDAPTVVIKSDGKQSTYIPNIVDAPPTVDEANKTVPVATLTPGESLSLNGSLSPSYSERGNIVKLYGGNDIDDVYLIHVKPEAGSSLRVKLTPSHGSATLLLSLMTGDGFILDASYSKEGRVPATAQVNFTRQGEQDIFIKVSLVRANAPELGYTLEAELTKPVQKPTITEQQPPLFPESQARTIVIGASAMIIIITIASVIVGRYKRRGTTTYGYEW